MLSAGIMADVDLIRLRVREALERCDVLAQFSEERGKITRTFLSPPFHQVHEKMGEWAAAAEMSARLDGLGNFVARREGTIAGGPALLIGSHLDTVPDAGKYD